MRGVKGTVGKKTNEVFLQSGVVGGSFRDNLTLHVWFQLGWNFGRCTMGRRHHPVVLWARWGCCFFYATSLLSYYEKLLPMRRPDVLFFVPTTILFYVAYNNQQLWTCTYGKQNCFFIFTFCTKTSLHGLPSIINLTHGTFVFWGSEKGALVIYVVGIHSKNH